jgi:hypothetical protein
MLCLEARRQHGQQFRHTHAGRRARRGTVVAIFLSQVLRGALGKAAGILQARMHQLEAARPTQPVFAADFVGKAKDQGAFRSVGRQQ